MSSPTPSLVRLLRLPLGGASLLLVGITALLLTFFDAFGPQVSMFGWLGTYLMCVWVNRYAFALLDGAANGEPETPVASVEMLGPFSDARSWVLPAAASLAVLGVMLLPPDLRAAGLAAVALLLPLPVAACEVSDRLVDALNPLAWWRTLRGLGVLYPLLLAGFAVAALLGWLAWSVPLWRMVQFVFIELLYLACFALLGTALFARREALEFTPRRAPERAQQREDEARALARQRMIDEGYKSVRARRPADLGATLAQWLATSNPAQQRDDATALLQASRQWSDPHGRKLLQRVLVEQLGAGSNPSLALEITAGTLQEQPHFAPQAAVAAALVRHARQTGRRRLADALLANALRAADPADRAMLEALQDGPPD